MILQRTVSATACEGVDLWRSWLDRLDVIPRANRFSLVADVASNDVANATALRRNGLSCGVSGAERGSTAVDHDDLAGSRGGIRSQEQGRFRDLLYASQTTHRRRLFSFLKSFVRKARKTGRDEAGCQAVDANLRSQRASQ